LSALPVAVLALAAYALGYRVYSRWLARRLFRLDPAAATPAHRMRDGVDYVPTRPLVLFGHHFASIAGLAPMLGPAVAVFWGWLPALVWVVLGALLVGCVHDFTALVLSVRHGGHSIGALCERILGPFAKALFLALIFFGVALAMGVFVYVISVLFTWGDDFRPDALHESVTSFPMVVMPSAGLMVLALVSGWLLYVRRLPLAPVAAVGFALLLGLLGLAFRWPTMGFARDAWPAQTTWIWLLMGYAWLASVLPVWLLLQARDFLNSLLLFLGLGLMYLGFFLLGPRFDAPAVNPEPTGAPPLFPFVFVTIACGAASGFHALVASGTTSRQLDREPDARPIGYGGMMAESLLGLIAVLACTATLGGHEAWARLYVNWAAVADSLGAKLGVFIRGAASFVAAVGVPPELATTLVAMVVVSFALTTLDSATRILRFNVEEIASSLRRVPLLGAATAAFANRFLATSVAVAAILFFAFYEIDGKPAGLALWTLFGGTNQLIAGLALLTGAVYLHRIGRRSWPLLLPAAFMLVTTLSSLAVQIGRFARVGEWLLLTLAVLLVLIGLGVAVAAVAAWRRPLTPASGPAEGGAA